MVAVHGRSCMVLHMFSLFPDCFEDEEHCLQHGNFVPLQSVRKAKSLVSFCDQGPCTCARHSVWSCTLDEGNIETESL